MLIAKSPPEIGRQHICVGPIAGVATEVWLAYNRRLSRGVARITERGSSIERKLACLVAGTTANWSKFSSFYLFTSSV